MAYRAIYDGEKRGAWMIPAGEDAYCEECDERMRVWREGADGTARHLKHISNMGGGDGGGGTECGGGEDPDHVKWKNFAAERLQEIFGDNAMQKATVEGRIAAPVSSKEYRDADALIYFDDWDEQFGRGLAVEVQNENKDKNIPLTTVDYARQDIATVWLYEDDFAADGCKLNEVDFRHKARQEISHRLISADIATEYNQNGPKLVSHNDTPLSATRTEKRNVIKMRRDSSLARNHHSTLIPSGMSGDETRTSVTAPIPNEYFDDHARDLLDAYWDRLFAQPLSERYIEEVAESGDTSVPAEIPTDHFWYGLSWDSRFNSSKTQSYIDEVRRSLSDGSHEVYFPVDERIKTHCSQCGKLLEIGDSPDLEKMSTWSTNCSNCGDWTTIYDDSQCELV
jgi:hypothetical protein